MVPSKDDYYTDKFQNFFEQKTSFRTRGAL